MIEIKFQFDTQYGVYSDALYFPNDEPLPPPEVIEAMKLERLNNWLAFVENPPPPPPYLEMTDG